MIRTYSTDEIAEVNQYIQTNVQHTILNRLVIITEEPISKVEIFLLVHRIMKASAQYVSNVKTREKIIDTVKESASAYALLDDLHAKLKHSPVSFATHRIKHKIIMNLVQNEIKEQVDTLINAFLVFADKIELTNLDTASGLDMEKDQGKDVVKELYEQTQ